MLHFFRKIRRDLIDNSKSYKYFKYAIGEIVLVVLGILIALQINNWNENRNISKTELALLANLKNEINSDILYLQWSDSIYAKKEAELEIAIKLFNKAKTIKDIVSADSLINNLLNELKIQHFTYDEMVSLSIGYSMKNKVLQKFIAHYYLTAESYRYYINAIITEQSQLWRVSPEIQPYSVLISQIERHQVDLKLIDTSWIGNPKSSTYIAVCHALELSQESNVYRRFVYQDLLKRADTLKAAITNELEIRNK